MYSVSQLVTSVASGGIQYVRRMSLCVRLRRTGLYSAPRTAKPFDGWGPHEAAPRVNIGEGRLRRSVTIPRAKNCGQPGG